MFRKGRMFGLGNKKQASRDLGWDDGAGEEGDEPRRLTSDITAFTIEVTVVIADVYTDNGVTQNVWFSTLDGIPIAHFDPEVPGEDRIVNIMVGESIARHLEVDF